jgi:hypothetical protein
MTAVSHSTGRRALGARAAGLVTAVTLVATGLMCAAPGSQLARVLPVEDGFYTLSVARQIGIGGGITIDGHTATDGFQPLWAFVVAPLSALTGGDRMGTLRLALILSTALWLIFVGLLAALAREHARRRGLDGRLAAVLAAIAGAGSVSLVRMFHSMLETGLLLTLLAGAVLMADGSRPWTARRTAAMAALLAALVYARLDAAAFVAALAVAVGWRAWRSGDRLAPLWLACAVAAVALVPWLAHDLSIDGHLVPTSGRAEALFIDPHQNRDSMLRALGAWALTPFFRPSMRTVDAPWQELIACGTIVLVAAAARVLRRPARRAGAGTLALAAYVAFLAVYYTWKSGAWWFDDRYLAPAVLVSIPLLAAAAERRLRGRAARAAPVVLAAAVMVANVPLLAVLVAAPRTPPSWATPLGNLGTHPNLNYDPQVTWTLAHVRPQCTMGGFESGTLGYFRDRVVNLDGKVDADALAAELAGRTPAFVRARGVEAMVDIPSGIARATRGARPGEWRRVARLGRFQAWVRADRLDCVQNTRSTTRAVAPPSSSSQKRAANSS